MSFTVFVKQYDAHSRQILRPAMLDLCWCGRKETGCLNKIGLLQMSAKTISPRTVTQSVQTLWADPEALAMIDGDSVARRLAMSARPIQEAPCLARPQP